MNKSIELLTSKVQGFGGSIVKVTFNIPKDEFEALLKSVGDYGSMTVTEYIRRAVKSQNFIETIVKSGEQLLIRNRETGKLYNVNFKP